PHRPRPRLPAAGSGRAPQAVAGDAEAVGRPRAAVFGTPFATKQERPVRNGRACDGGTLPVSAHARPARRPLQPTPGGAAREDRVRRGGRRRGPARRRPRRGRVYRPRVRLSAIRRPRGLSRRLRPGTPTRTRTPSP